MQSMQKEHYILYTYIHIRTWQVLYRYQLYLLCCFHCYVINQKLLKKMTLFKYLQNILQITQLTLQGPRMTECNCSSLYKGIIDTHINYPHKQTQLGTKDMFLKLCVQKSNHTANERSKVDIAMEASGPEQCQPPILIHKFLTQHFLCSLSLQLESECQAPPDKGSRKCLLFHHVTDSKFCSLLLGGRPSSNCKTFLGVRFPNMLPLHRRPVCRKNYDVFTEIPLG